MATTLQEQNKALVLEAFDTLFNKRDYVAAKRFGSPNYIPHSAHIEPRAGEIFNLIKGSSVDTKIRAGTHRRRRRLCGRACTVQRFRGTSKLDCC